MSQALRRGSVVLRAKEYGVVWDVRGADLVILPVVTNDGPVRSHDVELGLSELIAAAIAVPDARIRVSEVCLALAAGQVLVGELVGATLCRVVVAVARAHEAAATDQRWSHERRHREEAGSIGPVRI